MLLDRVVVRVEVGAGHRPGFVAAVRQRIVLDEPVLVLAQQDVRVDQRAAAEAARHDRVAAAEPPDVEHAVEPGGRVPERLAHLRGGAGEAVRRVGVAALEHDDRQAGLGQPVGRYRAAEAGADDHYVGVLDCWPVADRVVMPVLVMRRVRVMSVRLSPEELGDPAGTRPCARSCR